MRLLSVRSVISVSVVLGAVIGCGSTSEDATNNNTGGSSNPGGGGTNTATGDGGQATGVAGTPGGGSGGAANPGGGAGGTTTAGSGGVPGGGAGGDTTAGGSGGGGAGGVAQGGAGAGGVDDCGQPLPLTPISTLITAPAERYTHTANGRAAAVDLRLPIIMGKLVVDLDVDMGAINQFAVDRGFHTFSGYIFHCDIKQNCPFPAGGEEFNTNCRWNTFDGMDHGGQTNMTPETSLTGQLKGALQELAINAPGEGWDYFLDADGNVRWSDIGFTGYSHGAQTAALIATKQCIWRAVARSGPRDNGCGNGAGSGEFDPNNPPWNPACMGCISTWLNETPASPISHFYGFVGRTDVQYGDIMFSMERMGFIGQPVNISTTDPGDSHRFYSGAGHDNFTGSEFNAALQKAWGVPDENMAYAAVN